MYREAYVGLAAHPHPALSLTGPLFLSDSNLTPKCEVIRTSAGDHCSIRPS